MLFSINAMAGDTTAKPQPVMADRAGASGCCLPAAAALPLPHCLQLLGSGAAALMFAAATAVALTVQVSARAEAEPGMCGGETMAARVHASLATSSCNNSVC
jgi:hypothetical protein